MSNLRQIAARLRDGLEADAKDRAAWIERVLERARLLAEAKDRLKSNERFSKWLDQERIDIGPNDRAALISMARHPELARTALEKSTSVSAQWIWSNEICPLVAEKVAAKLVVTKLGTRKREVAMPVSSLAGKETILSHSLRPPRVDVDRLAQRRDVQVAVDHLRALCALSDLENLVCQAIAAGDVSKEDVDNLVLALSDARDTITKADGTLANFMAGRKTNPNSSLN